MSKRVFALASVTALSGLIVAGATAGCSGQKIYVISDEGGTLSGIDGGKGSSGTVPTPLSDGGMKKQPIDASPDPDPDPNPDPGATCPTSAPIDATTAPWSPPQSLPGSCTATDIDNLVAYVTANPATTYPNLKSQIANLTCRQCLFVPDGAKWGPFVEKSDGTFLRNNFGGCVAVASGSVSCGKAFSQLDDCLSVACQDCADATELQKCSTAATKAACKNATTAFSTQCPDASSVTTCSDLATTYTFEAAARALCVATPN
jgi:hypothetical protein